MHWYAHDRLDDYFRGDLHDKWGLGRHYKGAGGHFRISFIRSAFCARFLGEVRPRFLNSHAAQ